MDLYSLLLAFSLISFADINKVAADIDNSTIPDDFRDTSQTQITSTRTITKRANKDSCPEEKLFNGNKMLTWRETHYGVTTWSNELCANETGFPAKRYCDSNQKGAFWHTVVGTCSDQFKTSNKTDQLHSLLVGYILNGDIRYQKIIPTPEELKHFTYMDQYLLARLFYAMALEDHPTKIVQNFKAVLNNMIELNLTENSTTSEMFAPHNYTLAAINVFFKRMGEEQGPTYINSTNFYIQISNPFIDNTTGFAMYKQSEGSFQNYTTRKVRTNESYDQIPEDGLEVAGYVSAELLDLLRKNMTAKEQANFKVLIGVFYKNKFFKLKDKTEASRVIAVSISGFCSDKDISLFNIFLKPLVNEQDVGEWFEVTNNDIYNGDIVAECQFAPITYMFLYDSPTDNKTCRNVLKYPFVEVNVDNSRPNSIEYHKQRPDIFNVIAKFSMSVNYAQPQRLVVAQYMKHEFLLHTIMLMGCSLSILGVIVLILTVIIIKRWHERRWYSIQLVITMASEAVLFLISTNLPYIAYIILYYFILSQFAWMMLIGYIQYLKFVKIFNENSLANWHSLIIGWIIPLIIVVIPIFIYPHCLHCSCKEDRTIISYFVILPTSLVILGNIIIYVLIMVSISRSKSKEYGANISKKQTRIGLLLPFLLGLTWVFVFALVLPWSVFALIGSYLLHLIAPIQAFVLFIFIVVLDADTRNKWKQMIFVCRQNKPHKVATSTTELTNSSIS